MNQSPPYKRLTQIPYGCVPACVSMVLNRRKIKHGSQKEIGRELGLLVGTGTQVGKNKYSLNNYFRKHKIDLIETYFPTEKVADARKFILDNLKAQNDLIVCFDYGRLFKTNDHGHASLIQGLTDETITLIDPDKAARTKRTIKLPKLIDAMKFHGKKNRGGFWIISDLSNKKVGKE